MTERVTFCKTELRQRGWSDRAIKALLPPPRVIHRRGYGGERYPVHFWRQEIVLAVEESPEFEKLRIKRRLKLDEKDDDFLKACGIGESDRQTSLF